MGSAKLLFCIIVTCIHFANTLLLDEPILSEIEGYHFHTYYFPRNPNSLAEGNRSRERVIEAINSGILSGCVPGRLNLEPVGPHTIAQFVTCCNSTAHSQATSWFMQNRGNLTVLLHALTRYELADHSDRAMFIGPSIRLDNEQMSPDLGEGNQPKCFDSLVQDEFDDIKLTDAYRPYH